MKVYRIVPDTNNYQDLQSDDTAFYQNAVFNLFDGSRMFENWEPPIVYSLYPKLKAGDFWGFGGVVGAFIASPNAIEKVIGFFEEAGEVLPLPYKDHEYAVLNVTECIDVLDDDRSGWLMTDEGEKAFLENYVFHSNRFGESTLFKIPETCRAEVLVLERTGNPEEEFKAFVEAEGMTGLEFRLLWSEE